jgi:hypothetical protein
MKKFENESYEYLGSLINNIGDCLKEIRRKLTIILQKLNTRENIGSAQIDNLI